GLSRLTTADSLTVVHSIGQQDALPQSLARTILEKADGNPLFLEELTRVMVAQGGIRPDATVPDTLQGVLMARIDRLPDDAKRLEDAYDRLAYHYSKAEHAEKAVEYLTRFAEKAAREHAHVEAILALQGALAHGERLPAERSRERLLLDLHLRLALSLAALG